VPTDAVGDGAAVAARVPRPTVHREISTQHKARAEVEQCREQSRQ
jgi:hypothetical protein